MRALIVRPAALGVLTGFMFIAGSMISGALAIGAGAQHAVHSTCSSPPKNAALTAAIIGPRSHKLSESAPGFRITEQIRRQQQIGLAERLGKRQQQVCVTQRIGHKQQVGLTQRLDLRVAQRLCVVEQRQSLVDSERVGLRCEVPFQQFVPSDGRLVESGVALTVPEHVQQVAQADTLAEFDKVTADP